MIWCRIAAAIAIVLTTVVQVLAFQPDEVLPDPALEARARALSEEMRCLVCQNQSIDDSDAPLARDLRLTIRERLKAGDTDDEIVRFMVARYGEFVLLRPRFEPATWALWGAPFAVLLIGAAILLRRRRALSRASLEPPLTPAEEAELQRLLRDPPTPGQP